MIAPPDVVPMLRVALGDRGYPIRFVDGPVRDPAVHEAFWVSLFADCGIAGDLAVVTNEIVAPLYGDALCGLLERLGRRVVRIVVPDGERFKDGNMLATIHDALLAARLDRGATVVALGGGVVGDVAGFAAATFLRGVRFVQVPTTLLAQVDSSVGGKTGINHRLGKNLIGAFHQPTAVVIDLATLDTLPAREFAAGLAEVVKYGASLDAAFFDWLDGAMPQLLARERSALARAIRRSCEIKAEIVGDDEREAGRRALLNFGHTFGHAIEGAAGYGTWLHGEAVAAGMVMATALSVRLGRVDKAAIDRLVVILRAAGLPVEPPVLPLATWRDWFASDKKVEAGRVRFVLLDRIGQASVAVVDDAALDATLRRDPVETATAA